VLGVIRPREHVCDLDEAVIVNIQTSYVHYQRVWGDKIG
jgi:hypothetical protein